MDSNISAPSSAATATDQRPQRGRDLAEVALLLVIAAAGVVAAQIIGPATRTGTHLALAGVLACLAVALLAPLLRGEGWRALGLGRPRSWPRTVLWAVVATVVLTGLGLLARALLAGLTGGGEPDVSRFDHLHGNLPALLSTLAAVWFSAAFSEEVIYRGFLMGRLARCLGGGRGAWVGSLVLSSVVFGLLHLYQGLSGVLLTGFVGALLGGLYLVSGRNLWVTILTHGLIDSLSLTLVYLELA